MKILKLSTSNISLNEEVFKFSILDLIKLIFLNKIYNKDFFYKK